VREVIREARPAGATHERPSEESRGSVRELNYCKYVQRCSNPAKYVLANSNLLIMKSHVGLNILLQRIADDNMGESNFMYVQVQRSQSATTDTDNRFHVNTS